MSELELKITVRSSGSNIGDLVRRLVVDGEEDGVVLTSNGYTLNIAKLERLDGLPLAVEEDFADWWASQGGLHSASRHIAYNAYLAGRAAK